MPEPFFEAVPERIPFGGIEATEPLSFKVYDPTTTDKENPQNGKLTGRRTQEYLVLPQQTGQFSLPGMELVYFDPESGHYESSKTDPLTITVAPGAGGAKAIGTGGQQPVASVDPSEKNQLQATGLKGLMWKKPCTELVSCA